MKTLKFLLPALILIGGISMTSVNSYGKAEFTKKEKKGCTFCHKTAKPTDGKDLTDAGKYYHEKKSLEGFKPAAK